MGTRVVPVPIDSSCTGVMYHLGNHNYQCITIEDYNDRIAANVASPEQVFWIGALLVFLGIVGFVCMVLFWRLINE